MWVGFTQSVDLEMSVPASMTLFNILMKGGREAQEGGDMGIYVYI